MTDKRHPRDRFITIYGRKPVLELLGQTERSVTRVLLDRRARGPVAREILARAEGRGLTVERVSAAEVTRLSRHAKQDQGVVADVEAPQMDALSTWLERRPSPTPMCLWLLDGITNASNVGMMLRSAVAFGVDGVVLPRKGCPEVGPLVIKASAGIAYEAPILRVGSVEEGVSLLDRHDVDLVGLAGDAKIPLHEAGVSSRCVLAFGNETRGISEMVRRTATECWSIPMSARAESLNVAVAASVVGYELARRRMGKVPDEHGGA